MKTLGLLTLTAGLMVGTTASAATIGVTGSDSGHFDDANDSAFSYTVANSGSVLVIGFYVDSVNGGISWTFDGQAADGFLVNDRTRISYWENPDVGAGIFDLSGANSGQDLIVGAYELSNVDLTTVTSSTGSSITTPTDNEFVISFAGRNSNTAPTPGGTSIIDSNPVAIGAPDNENASLGGGTGVAGLAGSQDVTWVNFDEGTVSLSFQAVPEPSSLALLGLGGLLMAGRRRRN